MMAHEGRMAAARAMNKKLAAKKDQLAVARASRVPALHPETGAHLGYRSPFEMRDDGRVSLTFTFFAGFGGTALGAEAIGAVCGGVFDHDETALRVIEGNFAPPPKVTSEGATLERVFDMSNLLPGFPRPGDAENSATRASDPPSASVVKAARRVAAAASSDANAALERVPDAKRRREIVEGEDKDAKRPTSTAGRLLRTARNSEKRADELAAASTRRGSAPERKRGASPGDSPSASTNDASAEIENPAYEDREDRVEHVANHICDAIRGVLMSLGLPVEFESVSVNPEGVNVELAKDFDIYLQFSPPCQEASNNNPNGDRDYTKHVLLFLVDVEARIRAKLPVTGSWYEMVNGAEIGRWMTKGQRHVVVGEQGREEVVVDLEAVKVTSQEGYTTAQRRQRMLWVSGNRRREASAKRVARDLRRLAVFGRDVPASTVLGLDPEVYEFVDHRRGKMTRKPLDDLIGYTMTSNPPSIGKKGTDETYPLSPAQVLALQGFDGRAFYVPSTIAETRTKCLVGFANMVPLQLAIAVWRALIFGFQEQVHPDDDVVVVDDGKGDADDARRRAASKTARALKIADTDTRVYNDTKRVWLGGEPPEKPPPGRTWAQIPLDPYAVMRAADGLKKKVSVGEDARRRRAGRDAGGDAGASPEYVGGGYFARLRSARDPNSCSPKDVPCMSGRCVRRASQWCEEEGVFFCEAHLASARDPKREWRKGRGQKLEHKHCTLCGGAEPYPERTPRFSRATNDARIRALAVTDMHACDDPRCHRAVCTMCLFARWANAPRLRCERRGFLCHVHDRRDKQFARHSDELRAKRNEREERASRREEAREAGARRASAPTTRARSEMERRGGRGRGGGKGATAT